MGLIPLFTNGIEPDDVELDLYLAELDDELNTAASKPNEVRDGYCGDEDKVAALPSVASEPTGKAVAKPTAKDPDQTEHAVVRPPYALSESANSGPGTSLEKVIDTFQLWLELPDPGSVEVVMATLAAMYVDGDPVYELLVGPPGSGKTEVINATAKLPHMHPASKVTEQSLLSGTSAKERSRNATGGLLRQVGNFGILLFKDFTSALSQRPDEMAASFAALREIYDGSWNRPLGGDGGQVLSWEGKMGIIGGVTEEIDRHHGKLNSMGERFLFYRMPPIDPLLQAARAMKNRGKEIQMRDELSAAVTEFYWEYFPNFDSANVPALLSYEQERLIALSSLVVQCRTAVGRDGRTHEVEWVPNVEGPARFGKMLSQLLVGMKLIGMEPDRQRDLLLQIGMDSIPPSRRAVFEYIAAHKSATIDEIAKAIKRRPTTIGRALEELECHYVVARYTDGRAYRYKIVDEWLDCFEIARYC